MTKKDLYINFSIDVHNDKVIFHHLKSGIKYTMYHDGIFYSSDGSDIPQILFSLRDFLKK